MRKRRNTIDYRDAMIAGIAMENNLVLINEIKHTSTELELSNWKLGKRRYMSN